MSNVPIQNLPLLTSVSGNEVVELSSPVPSLPGLYVSQKATTATIAGLFAGLPLSVTQLANIVLAGPSSGAAAFPTFRALVVADLPTVTVPFGGTGRTTLTNHGLLVGAAAAAIAQLAAASAGTILTGQGASADPSFSATPTLGASGTPGSLTFGNATSGTLTMQTVTGALGSVILSLPAATDQLIGRATTDTLTNKTYDTAGTGNVLKINGTTVSAVTGTGSVVLATSPTLVTPALGVATATSLNGLTVTTSTGTLTVAAAKTLTVSNALTLAGTDSTTLTFQGTDTYVGRATTDTLTNKTVTGLVLTAGTTAVAPTTFASGSNLTTAVAGSLEYDGTVSYFTPVATNRGVMRTEHFLSLSANQTGTNVNTAQTVFPGGGSTTITLPGNTTYDFEGLYEINTTGTTSHQIGILFAGSATITSIEWIAITSNSNDSATTSAASMTSALTASVVNITAAVAAATANLIVVHGTVRVNAGGTFIPQFQYSAAPGVAPTIRANTRFKMWAKGNGSVLSVGQWS